MILVIFILRITEDLLCISSISLEVIINLQNFPKVIPGARLEGFNFIWYFLILEKISSKSETWLANLGSFTIKLYVSNILGSKIVVDKVLVCSFYILYFERHYFVIVRTLVNKK